MSKLTALNLKLDLYIPEDNWDMSRSYLKDLTGRLASEIYRQDIEIEVHFRQGSLEILLTIAGSIYLAIGNYGSFRSGLSQIISDSKALKNLLISSLRKDGIPESAILKKRNLSTTPERVRSLLSRIDRFERQLPELGKDEARVKLGRLLKAVKELTYEMDFPEDINLLMQNLDKKFQPPASELNSPYKRNLSMDNRPTFLEPKQYKFPHITNNQLTQPNGRQQVIKADALPAPLNSNFSDK